MPVHLCRKCFKLMLVLFIIHITRLSITILISVDLSPNSISIATRLNQTLFKSSTSTCFPFTVPDNRSFFERESPQLNLPQRVLYSSHQNLLHRLRSLRLIIVSCARNVERYIGNFRNHTESIVDLFHPSSRILVFESDSADNTLAKLYRWSRAHVYTGGNLSKLYPERSERIAHCRNKLIKKAHEFKADYILVTDLDMFATTISSFISNFQYNLDEWSVMTASASNAYYDIWALRTLSDSVLNFDVWHRIWSIERSRVKYCSQSISDQMLGNNQKRIPINHGLIEVRSAFNGAGLYKANATYGCHYSGKNSTCEHVPFHLCIRKRNQQRIFINPEFLVG